MEKEREQLKEQLSNIEEKIRELEDRMPAHGVKPGMMAEMSELEDERDAILYQIAELK
jgi:hypothetical protein